MKRAIAFLMVRCRKSVADPNFEVRFVFGTP